VRAGAIQWEVDRVVEGFRRLARERAAENFAALETELEGLPADRRARGLAFTSGMPDRLEGDLGVFLDSIDFDALGAELFAPLFEARLSRAELAALLGFYRSPAGRAWLRERTSIADAASGELVARMEPTMETFMRQWFDEELGRLRRALTDPRSEAEPGSAGSEPEPETTESSE